MNKPVPKGSRFPMHLSAGSGFLMGAADAVPGVSGGTIALIVGIYARFIESLNTVVRSPLLIANAHGRTQLWSALGFLVPLAMGLLPAYYVVTKILVGPEDDPGLLLRDTSAPICYGFFFGLVLFSLREPWRRIGAIHLEHFLAAALGCAAATAFVGLPHSASESSALLLLVGGAGAIAVMLLPGVSGSLFLVIIGQYTIVAGAVHDRDIGKIGIFVAGMALGVVSFVPLLRYLLRNHHGLTLAALTGLMAGSLRALWPWKSSYIPKQPMNNVGIGDQLLWVILAACVGGGVVWLLARLERRILQADK